MAVTLEKTYVVNNLSRGIPGQLLVSLSEHNEEELPGTPYYGGTVGGLTLNVTDEEASKFMPGQLFKVALTAVKSA